MRICIPVDYVINENLPVVSLFRPAKRDIQKMSEYYNKGSNPRTLANTVKDLEKAVSRYYIAVAVGWEECRKEFYRRCIELGAVTPYMEDIRDKALKDKSVSLGDTSNSKSQKGYDGNTKVAKPAGTTAKPQRSVSNNRKVIDADTGFIINGNGATPFG